jgi:Pyridoxamine 5'-phosphate oxidase
VPAKGDTERVDVTDLDADPLCQLSRWLDEARAAGQPMPEAMTIATATSDGVPSARLVVLRGLQGGLAFFTDCDSDKGEELAANPRAAAVLHWLAPVHRQVRVTGPAERVSEDEADEYWRTRAPAVRLSAAASRQSPSSPAGRRWKRRSGTSHGGIPAEPTFPGRRAGAASGCCPPVSSSGRSHRTACTTGSATARKVPAGSPNGCRRDDRPPHQRQGRHYQAPARHLFHSPTSWALRREIQIAESATGHVARRRWWSAEPSLFAWRVRVAVTLSLLFSRAVAAGPRVVPRGPRGRTARGLGLRRRRAGPGQSRATSRGRWPEGDGHRWRSRSGHGRHLP